MTYQDIIAQVAQNLAWDAFDNKLIADIKFAIYWSLSELAGDSEALKNEVNIDLTTDLPVYLMPEDMIRPRSVVFTTKDGLLSESKELQYEELSRYKADGESSDVDMAAMYEDYILFSFLRTKGRYQVMVYPEMEGTMTVYYDALIKEDLNLEPKDTPPIPRKFHISLIDGAIYYLARREMANIAKTGNPDLLNVYLSLVKVHQETFTKAKERYTSSSMDRSTPPIAKPFNFYDTVEEY
jgi:hypothetical protein